MAKIVESLKFDRLYPNYSSRPKFVGKISVYTVFGPLLTPFPLCTYYVPPSPCVRTMYTAPLTV